MKRMVTYLQKGLSKIKQANKLLEKRHDRERYMATDEVLFV